MSQLRPLGIGSVRPDGRRVQIDPAPVAGPWATRRKALFVFLIAIYLSLPFIPIGGHPAVHLDLGSRHFYLFGAVFDASDVWRLVFLLLAVAFAILLVTAVLGRAWCGWACPQTVFLDGLIRPIQRWLRPRKSVPAPVLAVLRQVAFFAVAAAVAHAFLAYFIGPRPLAEMVVHGPGAQPAVFGFAAITTALLYLDLALFREQLCLVVCPYGRLQGALLDRDSLIIGYDVARGEPRGKVGKTTGDCVDCRRCVAVCPTGIDIRKGLQLDCIACTACVDACDDIMVELGRPRGLIRYDSENGLEQQAKRGLLRGRVLVYAGALAASLVAFALVVGGRAGFDAQLLRLPGAPYSLVEGEVRNGFELHLVNKHPEATTVSIEAQAPAGAKVIVAQREVTLGTLAHARIPIFVSGQKGFPPGARLVVRAAGQEVAAPLLGPPVPR